MKIALTGGAGFIGTALARRLVQSGHEVVALDNLSPQIHGDVPAFTPVDGVTYERLDVRDLHETASALEGCAVVYHLAAETGTAQSMYRIRDYVGANEMGTASLLEALTTCSKRPTRIILASSRSVYGEGAYAPMGDPAHIVQPPTRDAAQLARHEWELVDTQGRPLVAVPTPETLPFAPSSVYAATKAAQELLLLSACHALDIRPVIFRFQNVYGEGQSLQNPYTGIISIFYNRARQGMDIPIYEDGLESRDFIHIDDIVEGLVRALDADLPYGATANLGAGQPTTVTELADALIAASGHHVPTRLTAQYRVGDIRHCFADITRAREWLGWTPQVSLAEGLGRFCAWAKTQPVYEDGSKRAMAELQSRNLAPAD